MRYKLNILLVCFFLQGSFAKAQQNTDSLMDLYKTSKIDSIRFKAIDDYIWEYMYVNPDTSFIIAQKIYKDNFNTEYKKGLCLLLRTIGASFVIRGDNNKGIYYYDLSKQISELLNDDEGKAAALNGLGIIYSRQSNYSQAIEQYLESLASYERMKDVEGMSIAFNNIGLNYERQTQYEKALEFYNKSLDLKIKIGKPLGIAQAKINMGNVHGNLDQYSKALKYYNEALQMQKELNNPMLEAALHNSIGVVYLDQKNYAPALNYFMNALVLRVKMDDKYGAIDIRNNLAVIHIAEKRYGKAIEYASEAFVAATEMQNMEMIKETSRTLSVAHENIGNVNEAFRYYKIFNTYKDSVYNKENTEKSLQAELKYEFAKQAENNKLEQEKHELEQKEAIKRQSIIRNFLIAGFVFLLAFAFLIFRNLKQKQKANKQLQFAYTQVEEKSNLLEVRNKEVTDSIKYAKHLQLAILPPDSQVKKLLPDSFVLYKPKDIVSGDFYWIEEWGTQVLVAAADCTGHGVPGAFMSIVGNNLLQQAVFNFGLTKPFLILNNVNKNISRMLHQSAETAAVKDGMDIALLSIDREKNIVEYAGAFNPLWILRGQELIEIKADKHPVGVFVGEELKQFTHHEFTPEKGDVVYIFTDGYADQFGGPKGKKFKYKQLQEMIISNGSKPMAEQKVILENAIDLWQGELEQIDDILVIGIRL
ncbi:MAG: tetratricopeptide repeat protein [Bacteroidetes bacterium]|nr:tetratricopeptide repeat protein [Bacteroidota bacterium]